MRRMICAMIVIALTSIAAVSAHPGNTDSTGGHTCWTNCSYWGYGYGEYHYHGGYVSTPDYYDQGYTYGSEDAIENNHDIIVSRAEDAGKEDAQSDVEYGEEKEFLPTLPDTICEFEFSFRAGEYQDYIDGVNDGWANACHDLAEGIYSEAYSTSYDNAEQVILADAEIGVEDSSTDDTEDSTNWGSIIVIGIVASVYGIPILVGIGSMIKGWWKNL